jgi:spore coat-associated protein N
MALLQNRKVRLGIGVGAVVLAAVAIGAGTYAAFVDTQKGPSGSIAAGTLALTVGGSAQTNLFTGSDIKPGYTSTVSLDLTNAGNLPGTLAQTWTVTGGDGVCTTPEYIAEGKSGPPCNAAGDLQDQMTVLMAGPGITSTTPVTIAQFAANPPAAATLAGGAKNTYTFTFALPDRSDNNKVQGDTISVTSNFTLTQQ